MKKLQKPQSWKNCPYEIAKYQPFNRTAITALNA